MLYCFHEYTLDPASRELRHGAQRLAVEPKVFQVLLYLLEHRDRVVPKDELLAQCWSGTFVSESALSRCLARLRQAVQPPPTALPVIETRHRHGYRFVAEVTVHTPPPPITMDPALPPAPPPLQSAVPPGPSVSPETLVPSAPPPSAPLAPLPARPTALGAERRQLTVLCCDVVDATTLAGQLDLEDFRDVMGRYHATCTAALQHYGGHVAQYRGTELLVYFGYPTAHEDDARRAVHAGLGLVTAVHNLGSELGRVYGVCVAMRIGIHTGLVVVGGEAGDTPHGQLAAGATPHLAAKLQGLAVPNTVVISDATYQLVQGYAVCQPLHASVLAELSGLCSLYQVLEASETRGRLDTTAPQQHTPFVGREVELAVLQERAAQVRQRQGQVVLLQGEAGIGKSRLVQEVTAACGADGLTSLALRCSPYHQHTVLHPVSAWLHRDVPGDRDTPGPERLGRLEALVQQAGLDSPACLPLLASLLHLDLPEGRYPALQLNPQQQRRRTLETLVALVLGLAAQQPLLLLVEDLHWSDPTTLEWLSMVVNQGPTAPLFTLLTCRPTFASPWSGRAHVTLLTVPPLTSPQVAQMVQWLGEGRLPAAQIRHIVTQTDGVPLFVEEVTRWALTAQRLQGHPGGAAATPARLEGSIPATLRDALMARLDQLGPAKGTAQLGATIGREFSSALLQEVTHLEADLVHQDLTRLVTAGLLYQRGVGPAATYQFTHALVQEVAYASLLRTTRQHYHLHIAQVLEAQFPDTALTQPELLAHHYTEAGRAAQAIPYWQRAGQHASERSAHEETIAHLRQGIHLLTQLPASPQRTQQELACLTLLGPTLIATKGHASPEVAHVYARAHVLCQQGGDTRQRLLTLSGLRWWAAARADYQTAQTVGTQLLTLATQHHEAAWLLEAYLGLGLNALFLGEFVAARAYLEQGIALYDPQQHFQTPALYPRDTAVACWANFARLLWVLGYPEQALQWGRKAVALAQDLAHPFSHTFALFHLAELHHMRREVPAAQQQVEASLALSVEYGFELFRVRGTILHGWTRVMQGQGPQGVTQMCQALAAYQATGAASSGPYYALLVAEASLALGDAAAALPPLQEALASLDRTQERWWAAELYRRLGDLRVQDSARASRLAAEQSFSQAIALAQHQQAKMLELRAAMSLARLWQQQGQQAQARQLLAKVYGEFTEGFDTADLREAQTLLAALA